MFTRLYELGSSHLSQWSLQAVQRGSNCGKNPERRMALCVVASAPLRNTKALILEFRGSWPKSFLNGAGMRIDIAKKAQFSSGSRPRNDLGIPWFPKATIQRCMKPRNILLDAGVEAEVITCIQGSWFRACLTSQWTDMGTSRWGLAMRTLVICNRRQNA